MENKKEKNIGMGKLLEYALELVSADEVLERNVVGIGNGAHINIPLKHKGKSAKIIIKKKKEDEKVKL